MLSPLARQVLFAQPAFRHLGAAARSQAAAFFREVALGKDETVYRAGDDADALYLVVSGAVDVVDGRRTVSRYGPGEVFGESVLMPGEPRAVTARKRSGRARASHVEADGPRSEATRLDPALGAS